MTTTPRTGQHQCNDGAVGACHVCSARSQLNICADCVDVLDEALSTIPGLLYELEVTITRRDRLSTGTVGRSAPAASPINFGASRLLDEFTDVLWVLAEGIGCPVAQPVAVSRWLRRHLERIAGHVSAKDMFNTITNYTGDRAHPSRTGRLWQAIGRHTHVFAGFCPTLIGRDQHGDPIECGVTLYSDDEDAEDIECPKCGMAVNVSRNRQRAIMSRDLLPEARLLNVMRDLGENLCKERLHGWLRTGRLAPRGYLHGCQIVERRLSGRDARLLSLSAVRQLRWAEQDPYTVRGRGPVVAPPTTEGTSP